MATCAFHPDHETALSCTNCDRPACPDCLMHVAVGQHCVGCRQGRPAAGEKGLAAYRLRTAVVGVDENARLRRPGPAFYFVLGLFLASCVGAWLAESTLDGTSDTTARVAAVSVVITGALLGLVFHEWAHAIVAFRGGDRTVAEKGYLTLDVRHYSNPLLSIGMPMLFLLLGGLPLPGGAVWINHHYLRTKWWDSAVSFAGPAINFLGALGLFAIVATGILGDHNVLAGSLIFLGFIEIGIVLLNLLPVPGLDGYGVIEPHLPESIRRILAPIRQYSFLILLVLIMNGDGLRFIWVGARAISVALGIDIYLAAYGEELADPQIF